MTQINEFIKILLILRQQINEIVRNNYELSYQSEETLKKTINQINSSVDDEIPKLTILSRKLEFFFKDIATDTSEKIKNIIMIIWLIELELLYQPLKNLKGAGKVFCELFAKKHITTIIDLIEYLPYNYEIYRVSKISEIYADEYFI
ncbi:MAG TPA: hypothetical protein PLJ38_08915, partial [bacterium]|nr:hypothetical protein [bacterium]